MRGAHAPLSPRLTVLRSQRRLIGLGVSRLSALLRCSVFKILLIGGKGYFGVRVAGALRTLEGVAVRIATRNPGLGEVALDLRDPAGFHVLAGFDAVVNCSDTLAAPPDSAISAVLARGGMWIETTDETGTILRLLQRYRDAGASPQPGRLIIGLGIMPGLSTLVAAKLKTLVERSAPLERLEVAIRLNPLSGAGAGMSALSARLLANVSKRFEGGALIKDPPVWFSPLIPFDGGPLPALRIGLPEAVMLGYSTGVPNTAAYFTTGLPFAQGAMLGLSILFPQDAVFKPLATDALGAAITGLRGGFFRDGVTPFEIVALANRRDAFRHDGPSLHLRFNDGITAAARAVAAGVDVLRAARPDAGAYLPDELFKLDDMLARLRQFAGARLSIDEVLSWPQNRAQPL